MKSKIFLRLIIPVFAFFSLIFRVQAAPISEQEAAAWTNQTGYRLIEALGNRDLEAKFAVLDQMFEQDVDTEYLARFVMGRYWKSLNEEQKGIYLPLFKRYVLSLYKNYPLDFDTAGLGFTITGIKTAGNYTDVSCRIKLPDQIANENFNHVNVEFKLSKNGGKIKIIDLKIGESSLLLTYRSRFYTMIKEVDEDMTWFLEDFNDLTVSNERNVQEKLDYM